MSIRSAGGGRPAWGGILLPCISTILLLCGISAQRALFRRTVVNATPYHERVREVAGAVPVTFGDWLGVDVPVPQGAVALLKPNVIISRRYDEIGTGRRVTLLVVQCRDARDILGHFPPVCYPGQGWQLVNAMPHDWNVEGLALKGMSYEFRSGQFREEGRICVDNFMLLPSGRIARDMDEVSEAAQDSRQKFLGAAQVQLVYDGSVSARDRSEIFEEFVTMLRPLLATVMQQHAGGEG